MRRLAVLLVFVVAGVTSPARAERTALFHFRHFHLRGDELRVILDSALFVSSPLSHSSSTRDEKGWLVCIDLASTKPLANRARLYGPLWDAADAQSSLSHQAGVVFTERDQRAAAARAFVAFDDTGNVVRIRGDTRDILELAPSAARWRAHGSYRPSEGRLPPGSEDEVQTLTHRHRLRRVNGQVQLTETLSGVRVPDPWLEAAFATYRGMKDMGNVRAWVTDDLQYLVCFPDRAWSRQRHDGPPGLITTFEWGGRTYDRPKWAFYFRRPNRDPLIFQKWSESGQFLFEEAPAQTIAVEGEPYFLYLTQAGPVLAPLAGGTRLSSPVPPGDGWLRFPPTDIRHDPAAGELLFFGRNDPRFNGTIDGGVMLFRWSYRKGPMTRVALPTEELFRRSFFNHFVPKNPLKIEDR